MKIGRSIAKLLWRTRRVRRHPQGLIVLLVVLAVIGIAITHGVQDGSLTWAMPIFIAVLLPSVMLHEISHGVAAYVCGDDTAKRAGRLSLNPKSHIDPLGSIVLPIGLVLLGGPGFGYAVPVPVTLNRLHHPRNQAVLVSLAGPFWNGLMAAGAGVGLHFIMATNPSDLGNRLYVSVAGLTTLPSNSTALYWLGIVVGFFGLANLFIGAFNLLPIPPLDGSAIVERFLPLSALQTYHRIRTGFMIFLLIILFLDRTLLGTLFTDIARWYLNILQPPGTLF